MKFNLKLIKNSRLSSLNFSLRYIYGLIIFFVILVFSQLGFFLYKNLYLPVTQSEEIIIKAREVAPNAIDMEKVGIVLQNIDKKTTSTEKTNWSALKNPFIPLSPENPILIQSPVIEQGQENIEPANPAEPEKLPEEKIE